jgi:hypothetical protein
MQLPRSCFPRPNHQHIVFGGRQGDNMYVNEGVELVADEMRGSVEEGPRPFLSSCSIIDRSPTAKYLEITPTFRNRTTIVLVARCSLRCNMYTLLCGRFNR